MLEVGKTYMTDMDTVTSFTAS